MRARTTTTSARIRILTTALLAGSALALGACGDDDQSAETRTVIQTVPAPADDGALDSAPDGVPTAAALPEGVTALQGTYVMRFEDEATDYGNSMTTDEIYPDPAEWRFETTCRADACTVAMRRQLDDGAYKSQTLRGDPQRPDVYTAQSTGMDECGLPAGRPAKTRQRYSVKVNASSPLEGRDTATSIDAYFTETSDSCDIDLKGTRGASKSTASWTGRRQP